MSLSFIDMASNHIGSAGQSTIDCSTPLNVQNGDLLVLCCKWENGDTTFSAAKDSGSPSNTFTFDAANQQYANGFGGVLGYVLSASADSNATFRLTLGAARDFPTLFVLQFRPDAGEVASKDGDGNIAHGTSTAPNSGNFSTTGTDNVIVGFYGAFSPNTTSSELIDGGAATEPTGSPEGDSSSVWYRLMTTSFTNGAASATLSNNDWVCAGIAFKAEASSPTIDVQPQPQTVYVGETATFTVSATGVGTLHYQWKKDGNNVGTDSDTYITPAVDFSYNGSIYTVDVTDDVNTITSDDAILTVLFATQIAWFKA